MIGMWGMVSRALLRYTRDYLTPGMCSLFNPTAKENWCRHYTKRSIFIDIIMLVTLMHIRFESRLMSRILNTQQMSANICATNDFVVVRIPDLRSFPFSVGCWNAFIVFNLAIVRLRNEKWDIVKQANACFESHGSLGTLRFYESCDRRTYIDLPCLFKLIIRRRLLHDNMLRRLLQQHKRMW